MKKEKMVSKPDAFPIKLPVYNGYTIDLRLKEFRRVIPYKIIEFIPFDTEQGKALFELIKKRKPELLRNNAIS